MKRAQATIWLMGLVVVAMLARQAAGQIPDTSWTGGAQNGLWGDAGNWSNGLPSASRSAEVLKSTTIDLGGQRWEAKSLDLAFAPTISNGTLASNLIYGDYFVVARNARLTALDGRLSVGGYQSVVNGAIVGDGFEAYLYGSFASEQLHTGPSVINGGTYLIDDGAVRQSAKLVVVDQLNLDNRGTNSGDRVGDSMPVEIWGGSLRLIGNAGAASSERIGPLSFMGGGSVVFLQATGQPLTITASSLQRTFGSIGYVNIDPAMGRRILLDNPPMAPGITSVSGPTGRPVIPYLRGNYTLDSLITYDSGADPSDPLDDVGLRKLDPATEFATAIVSGASPQNVWVKDSPTVSSPATVNALVVEPGLTVNDTLSVASGSITIHQSAPDAGIVGNGRLRVPGEAIISAGGSVVIGVPIEAEKMTINGEVTLAKANAVAGGAYLVGDITVLAQGALGSGPIRFTDGSLSFASVDQTISNDIEIGPELPAGFPDPGLGYFDPFNVFKVEEGRVVTLSGKLSGKGSVMVGARGGSSLGKGLLRIDGDGTFSSLDLGGFNTAILEINGTIRSSIDPAHLLVKANLRGSGSILGTIVGGRLSPGPDGFAGRMTISTMGSFDEASAQLMVEIGGTIAGEQYDQLVVLDALTHTRFDPSFGSLSVNLGYQPVVGDRFLIMDDRFSGAVDGMFVDLPEGTIFSVNGVPLQISYVGGDGNDVTLTAVPEPLGIFGVLLWTMMLVRPNRLRD